jgi:hypothetical protein
MTDASGAAGVQLTLRALFGFSAPSATFTAAEKPAILMMGRRRWQR